MDENPYKAPGEDAGSDRPSASSRQRWLAILLAFPCLLPSWLCLFVVYLAAAKVAMNDYRAYGPFSLGEAVLGIGIYSASAVSWAVTIWAAWKGRTYSAMVAMLADVALIAAQVIYAS